MTRRIPHASHWGAYTLLVDDGKITGVEPFGLDPAPSDVIHSVPLWATSERRIHQPMVREGWLAARHRSDGTKRGSEKFIPISWEEAEELVASEIARVASEHGNASIFAGSYGWSSCGRFHHAQSLLKRMMNLAGGFTGHVDTYSIAAGPVILRHTLGDDQACMGQANTLDTIAKHTQTLLVFGAMTPRTAQSEAGGLGRHRLEGYLDQIAANPDLHVLHISPYRDDLPEGVASEWWTIRPNTDAALLLALAGEVVKAGREDLDFLTRCTSGHEVYLAYLRGDTDGQVKDAEWAAPICGITAPQIRALAQRLMETRSHIAMSWALQRQHHGEQPFWAAIGLAAILGQIGLPGGGMGFGYGSLGGMGAPISLGKSPSMSQGKKRIGTFIPVSRVTEMLENPGAPFTYEGETHHFPDVKLVYWAGGNPYHHHQDLNRLERAWARPQTIIVQDPMWTATARRADIVLPASTSIERNDLAGNKRCDMILAMGQAIAPVGEARSDYDIFSAIAARLGHGPAFTEGRDEMEWVRHLYEESRSYAKSAHDFDMPDFDTFWAQGYAMVPTLQDHSYLAPFRADPAAHPLDTESGLIVLGSKQLDRLGLSDCPPHPAWLPPAEWLGAAEEDELHLLSHQADGRLHSQLEDAPASMATKHEGREQLRLHPTEAARRGIHHGQIVKIWNQRGSCLAVAHLSDAVATGVAYLPTGAWLSQSQAQGLEISGNPNVLTLDIGSSSFGQGCAAHTCLIRLAPHQGEAPQPQEHYAQSLARQLESPIP